MSINFKKLELILFIAGTGVNSIMAGENIKKILKKHKIDEEVLKIIDVYINPEEALKYNIFLTPALLVNVDGKQNVIFGNLSDTKTVEEILSLQDEE